MSAEKAATSDPERRNGVSAVAALLIVYIFWGSTTPAIKIVVAHVPPFVMASIRFAIAGSLLYAWSAIRGAPWPSLRDLRGAAISGTILLVLGNGVFGWTLQYIPAGVGALFFALSPLWNAAIGALFYREKLTPLAIAGVLGGFGGMAYLVSPGGVALPAFAVAVGLATSLMWSIGTMIQRRYRANDVTQMSAMQMLVASLLLAGLAAVSGERPALAEFTPAAIGGLTFLVIGGSILGFSAFLFVARHVPTVLASTYAYVNPVVALAIATFFLHEPLTLHTIIGGAAILASVALMLVPQRRAGLETIPETEPLED